MSRVFIAYNTKPIADTTKNQISTKLFLDPFKTGNKEEGIDDYQDLARYKQFGKLQIILPKKESLKFKIYSDTRYLICICGMIHNKSQLLKNHKHKDIDQYFIKLLKQGEKKLADFFSHATGQFVVFLYDNKQDKILIINDKLGLYSAYLYENEKQILFSTCAEAIASLPDKKWRINYDAIADYLALGIVQNRETFIRDINNLPPARILSKKSGQVSKIEQYYEFQYDDHAYSRKKYLPQVNEKLKQSVNELYNLFPGQTAVCLTGGFDTRLINSILHASGERQINMFSRYPVAKKLSIDYYALPLDEKLGRQFAKTLGLKYYLFKEGSNDKEEMGKRIALVNGLFGGEIFGAEAYNQPFTLFRGKIPTLGKTHFLSSRFFTLLSRDPIETYYQSLSKINSEEWEKKVFIYKVSLVTTTFFNNLEDFGGQDWQHPHRFFVSSNFLSATFNLYPYLNTDFLELVFKIPFSELDQHVFYKELLVNYYSKYLKVDILHGKKRYYKYRSNKRPKLFLYKKIEEEIRAVKSGRRINKGVEQKKNMGDFLDYIGQPIKVDQLNNKRFFLKDIEINSDELFILRLQKLHEWFKDNYFK